MHKIWHQIKKDEVKIRIKRAAPCAPVNIINRVDNFKTSYARFLEDGGTIPKNMVTDRTLLKHTVPDDMYQNWNVDVAKNQAIGKYRAEHVMEKIDPQANTIVKSSEFGKNIKIDKPIEFNNRPGTTFFETKGKVEFLEARHGQVTLNEGTIVYGVDQTSGKIIHVETRNSQIKQTFVPN